MARLTKAKVKLIKAKSCDLSYDELVELKVSVERSGTTTDVYIQ